MLEPVSEPHTLDAVLARGELTEEEIYFLLRFAGHMGYESAIARLERGALSRARKWLVWLGGWESPALLQWDRGWPAWRLHRLRSNGQRVWQSPTPVSLFGHRICLQHWGVHIRGRRGAWCWTWQRTQGRKIYWSPNGTPGHANARHYWEGRAHG